MVKIEMCTLSALAWLAGKVGRALRKERVGIYNVGITLVETT